MSEKAKLEETIIRFKCPKTGKIVEDEVSSIDFSFFLLVLIVTLATVRKTN
jgi:hypothetical protein